MKCNGNVAEPDKKISVLCVDDNEHVADAIKRKLSFTNGFEWKGWLPSADDLVDTVCEVCPAVVILDIDMPGKNPFEVMAELVERCPDTRVIVFSGHVRNELINHAVESGAWGYISKNDGEDQLIEAMHRVLADEFVFSPETRGLSSQTL